MVGDREVARLLGVSLGLVRKWRRDQTGPRYRKIGRRILYQLRDIDAYIAKLPAGPLKKRGTAA